MKVIDADNEVTNVLYRDIEERCIHCIALHQPVACDLRFIHTAINVAAHMEIIGNHARDIAGLVPGIVNESTLENEEKTLQKMCDTSLMMIKNAMNSFVNKNKKYINKVDIGEEKVDALYDKLLGELKKKVKSNNAHASLIFNPLIAAKCLERAGNHASKISKKTIYAVYEMRYCNVSPQLN